MVKKKKKEEISIYYASPSQNKKNPELEEEKNQIENKAIENILKGFLLLEELRLLSELKKRVKFKIRRADREKAPGNYKENTKRIIGECKGLIAVFTRKATGVEFELKRARKEKIKWMCLWDEKNVSEKYVKRVTSSSKKPSEEYGKGFEGTDEFLEKCSEFYTYLQNTVKVILQERSYHKMK